MITSKATLARNETLKRKKNSKRKTSLVLIPSMFNNEFTAKRLP